MQLNAIQEKARLIQDLNKRLQWLEAEKNEIEKPTITTSEAFENKMNEDYAMMATDERVIDFIKENAQEFREGKTTFPEILKKVKEQVKTIAGPGKLFEVNAEISFTKDLILIDNISQNVLNKELSKEDKQRLLVGFKHDGATILKLLSFSKQQYQAQIDKLIEELKSEAIPITGIPPLQWNGMYENTLYTFFLDCMEKDIIIGSKAAVKRMLAAYFLGTDGKKLSGLSLDKGLSPEQTKVEELREVDKLTGKKAKVEVVRNKKATERIDVEKIKLYDTKKTNGFKKTKE